MPMSDYARDKFIAPNMSGFTTATIRDMSACDPQQEYWVSNFILNTMVRVSLEERKRQYMFNFLRRVEAAFHEYSRARDNTLRYLAEGRSPSTYVAAITNWEVFLSQAWHSCALLGRTFDLDTKVFFNKGDGTVLERLNLLYNSSKHAESSIAAGNIPEEGTLCIWLQNDGLHSTATQLTFDELATEILEDLAVWADRLQDPLTTNEKIAAANRQP